MPDPEQRVDDDEITRMLRAFEGPDAPRRRPARSRPLARRAVLAGSGAAVVALGLAVVLLAGGGAEPREAALSGARTCSELQVDGKRFVARAVSPGAVAAAGPLGGDAVVLCGGSRVPDAQVVRLAGIDPAVALALDGNPGLVYVADESCPGVPTEADLLACLHNGGSGS